MTVMEDFYSREFKEFMRMVEKQKIQLPQKLCNNLKEAQYNSLYQATIIHEKPLSNALGKDFQNILTKEKVKELFLRM
jgi:3-deoxy-alpha-D-manno-octulosonate 8-oxidase